MSRIVLTAEALTQLRSELLKSPLESCAILFGRAVVQHGSLVRIVVREVRWVLESDYLKRSEVEAQLCTELVSAVTQRARRSGEALIFVHSHPFSLNQFSKADDAGEQVLAEFLGRRTPNFIHATMLVTPDVTIARVLGQATPLEVLGVGSQLQWGRNPLRETTHHQFDRQVRVFGAAAQTRLQRLRVGIVGLGGTGSIVLEQLTHLGITDFLLLDPDVVEQTNLNRLVGASPSDVGRAKVDVAATHAARINPSVLVETRSASALLAREVEALANTDFVFCCTDSQGSRAILNHFAYQYLVPVIDMGVAIVTSANQISHIAGRTQMLAPGLGCLVCGNLLNPEAVRVDLLTDFERANDPYIVGHHEPAPAVISLNSTVASMAVTMFLAAVADVPSNARLIHYNGLTGTARASLISPHPACVACSCEGALARANEWPLPARLS